MADADRPRATVGTEAAATLRQRPAVLLLLVRLRAAEATLELGLAALRRRSAEAARRLTLLGAARVEAGEPHADDYADPDPMARMRAAAGPRRLAETPPADRPGVNVALTATWDIAGRSAEDVLLLADRLRFDAAADADPVGPPDDPSPWASPEEQLRAVVAQMTGPPPTDRSPKFLYISRPGEEPLARAAADAYAAARRLAERLADAAGRRLGGLTSLIYGIGGADARADRLMDRQRAAALLAASAYNLGEGEVVSEDPRAAEVTVSVHATHHLE